MSVYNYNDIFKQQTFMKNDNNNNDKINNNNDKINKSYNVIFSKDCNSKTSISSITKNNDK